MIRQGHGQIVNTASMGGLMAAGLITSYVMTKHAVVGLSLALRSEAAAKGVGVTVVCPSAVDTPILDKGYVGRFNGRDYYLRGQGVRHPLDPDVLATADPGRGLPQPGDARDAENRPPGLALRPPVPHAWPSWAQPAS
jgi:NAD(P)-dependent dehydrogenase (short-subunit alcohol dehydrogenase family)